MKQLIVLFTVLCAVAPLTNAAPRATAQKGKGIETRHLKSGTVYKVPKHVVDGDLESGKSTFIVKPGSTRPFKTMAQRARVNTKPEIMGFRGRAVVVPPKATLATIKDIFLGPTTAAK